MKKIFTASLIKLLWIWSKKQDKKIEKPQAVHQDVLDSAMELADIYKDIQYWV